MKWICTVIQDSNRKYTATLTMDQKEVEGLPSGVDYKTLKEAILRKAGIVFVSQKQLIFEKFTDKEKIATIDTTQYLGEGKGCRVTIEDRINGWKPCWN